ncbi:MAG: hypothetical protein ACOX0M_02630 [Salinivirgaceae bacterium]|jgi:hypothetical protein|nr:hypothetical protein [Bacteroidales bacterium]
MKNIISNILFITVVSIALLFNSCSEKESTNPNQLDQKYSKNIEIFDKSGKNSIILKVSSDEESIVSFYSADNFELLINPEPFVAEETTEDTEDDSDDDFDNYSDKDAISITMGVIEERFSDNVVEYEIVKTYPIEIQDMRASFTKEHYYSTRDGVRIKRTSWNRRVYVWTKYCNANCGTGDADIEYGWISANYNDYKLNNNEEISDEVCGSTYMGIVVRAKKHSGKYSHNFYVPSCN